MKRDQTYNIWLEKRLSSEQVREYLEEIYKIPVALLTENYELESKQGTNPIAGFQVSYHQGTFKTEIYIWNPPEGISQNRIEEIRLARSLAARFDCSVLVDGTGYENYSKQGFDSASTNDSYSLVVDQSKILLVDDSELDLDDANSSYNLIQELNIREV